MCSSRPLFRETCLQKCGNYTHFVSQRRQRRCGVRLQRAWMTACAAHWWIFSLKIFTPANRYEAFHTGRPSQEIGFKLLLKIQDQKKNKNKNIRTCSGSCTNQGLSNETTFRRIQSGRKRKGTWRCLRVRSSSSLKSKLNHSFAMSPLSFQFTELRTTKIVI
jgi:hypothetical protein